jgi:hypothetical protein
MAQGVVVPLMQGGGTARADSGTWSLGTSAPDDPTRDWIRDCVRATQYRGRTIGHAT